MLFENQDSPRKEIIFDVEGSVRLPTIRQGDYKLMGDALYNVTQDPGEQNDIASEYPEIVKQLRLRLEQVAAERPPLGEKPLLMEPALPYVYGLEEQDETPDWLIEVVESVRAKQPKEWAPGETPWPKAPKGAQASKMDGLKDEVVDSK